MRYMKYIRLFGFFISLIGASVSFFLFYQQFDKLGTSQEIKFYLGLISFSLFFFLFLFSVIGNVFIEIIKRKKITQLDL